MSDNMTRLLALELLDGDTESNVSWMTHNVQWRDVRNAHRHVVDRLTRERDSAREAVRELVYGLNLMLEDYEDDPDCARPCVVMARALVAKYGGKP